MASALQSRTTQLTTLDRHIALELAWCRHNDKQMTIAVQSMIIACLPSSAKIVKLDAALNSLAALHDAQPILRGGYGLVCILKSVELTLQNIQRGIGPSADWVADNPFFHRVLARCAMFLEYNVAGDVVGQIKTVRGKSACDCMMLDFTNLAAKDAKTLTLHQLELLRPYFWLMDDTAIAKVTRG
jgi:hypothetical protein